mmetsp:Transcript_18983/g.17226  ORF Transcript_18983/g.17226 Transcript_18983/m.17226 type:complete len:92 (+) Transcript_18983:667-942(+)
MMESYFGGFSNKDKGNIFCVNRNRAPLLAIVYDLLTFPSMIAYDILLDSIDSKIGNQIDNQIDSKLDSYILSTSYLNNKPFCTNWPKCLIS